MNRGRICATVGLNATVFLTTACAPAVDVVLPEAFRGEPIVRELRRAARDAGSRLRVEWTTSLEPVWHVSDTEPSSDGGAELSVDRSAAFAELGGEIAGTPDIAESVCIVVFSNESSRAERDAFVSAWSDVDESPTILTFGSPANVNRVLAEIDQEGPFAAVVVAVGSATPEVVLGLNDLPAPPVYRAGAFVSRATADTFAALAPIDAAIVLDFGPVFTHKNDQDGGGSPQVAGRLIRY